MIPESLRAQLSTNPFFSGGMWLMLLGAALAWLRGVPALVWALLRRQLIITVSIPNEDEAFGWLNYWLSRQPYSSRSPLLTAFSVRGECPFDADGRRAACDNDDVRQRPQVRLAPGPGVHWFFYRGRLLSLERRRSEKLADGKNPIEHFEIEVFAWNRRLVIALLEEARQTALPSDEFLDVLIPQYQSWRSAFRQPHRAPETLVLPDGMWEKVLSDARLFLSGRTWYHQHGIPHRRGYLLYGPPGSGKTSLVKVLASALSMDVALLNLNKMELDDDALLALLAELVRRRAILLLEDVDAIFEDRRRTNDANRSGVTFSGLLNALDGVATADERILIMTTNHRERLDPALLRPGRIDRQFEIGPATREQARRLFANMLPDHARRADDFADLLTNPTASMAALQGILLRHRNNPAALWHDPEALATLRGPPSPDPKQPSPIPTRPRRPTRLPI